MNDSLTLRLPHRSLSLLADSLAEGRSPLEAAQLLRRIGCSLGESLGDAFARTVEAEGGEMGELPADRFWSGLSEFFAAHGWGTLGFERIHPGLAALSSSDWAEADARRGARYPSCHVTTGVFAELLGRTAGSHLAVLETECRSRGDARCQFVFGAPETLQALYESAQATGSLSAALGELT